MRNYHQLALSILAAVLLLFTLSCNASKRTKGAVIGGSTGGVIGGVIGKKSGNTAAGIVIGSVIGGSAGAIIGDYMDKQSREIEQDVEGAKVERVGEGIALTFDSGILFGFDSYALTANSKANLRELADILQKYADTELVVNGHTDSKGSDAYNQTLSEQRAASVADYLKVLGVSSSRITTRGYGETSPIATNETESGRAENRRVEVAITANEELQRRAENGEDVTPR